MTGITGSTPASLRKLFQRYLPDLRAIAIMRIAIGMVVLIDLLIRWCDLAAFFTDAGIWPVQLAKTLGWKEGYWSLHTLSGQPAWEHFLFAVHAAAAVCLVAGVLPRVAACMVWILYISLHNRNIYILQAGDDLLRLTVFWLIFLPCDVHYSLLRKHAQRTDFLLPATGYLLLIASVYFFAFILKTAEEWRSGDAIYFALGLGQLRLPAGDMLYRFPLLMKALTWIVLAIEVAIPLLVLWPSMRSRATAFVLIVILHLGIGSTLYVGLFFVIGIASAFALIPSWWLDRLSLIKSVSPENSPASSATSAAHIVRDTFIIAVIAVSLAVNVTSVPQFPYKPGRPVEFVANALRLDQFWGMFSPGVLRTDGWFVFEGIDAHGRKCDLRTGSPGIDFTRPAHIVGHYKSDRWRKLAENLQSDRFTFLRPCFSDYILRRWNKEHPDQPMATMNLYFMERKILPGYRESETVRRLLYVSHSR